VQAQEFRAAWADVFHVGMGSTTEVNNMVSALVTGHYNAVVVQVVAYMDGGSSSHGALWKSSILPWSTRVTSSFDPLSYLCTQAHANGIEVHAWLGGSAGAMYRVSTTWPPAGNTTLANNPQWFIAPLTNSEDGAPVLVDGNYDLDMGSPEAQEYIVSIVKELVTNYPIDGINWDDELNGAGYTAGFGYPAWSQANYAKSGLARYRINTGYVGTPSNTDTAWADYRRRYKNELMARVQAEMQSIKTNPRQPLRQTSAALAYSPVPSSCDFTVSVPYTYFCDWAGMLQHGWVDAVIPQTYSSSTFNTWADRSAACWQYTRQIFPGMGGYLTTDATIAGYINYTRSKGLLGNSIYSYAVPNSAGNSDWWAYAAANVYTNIVSTPPMPWRNPATATEGIVWGRVTDANTGLFVDDATVTVTGGPTVKTDGNGYYIATLVPATAGGTVHSTTVSKTGMTPQTTNTTALAGDIARYDLTLNAVVNNAPSITTQPQSQSISQGASATFTVTAIGAAPLSYQWRLYATNIAGATASTYTRTSVQPADAGPYSVVVSNAFGTTNSSDAQLTVIVPPTITTQPLSQTVTQGLSATFTVAASGTAPFSYQWRLNGTNISSATATSYTRSNVQTTDAGSYSVLVSNSAGSATSSNAVLTVIVPPNPPTITTQPQGQTVVLGGTASFSVVAAGGTPLFYLWRFNGADIGGATASSYQRANLHATDAGSYSVMVTNAYENLLSSNAVLIVDTNVTLPVITSQPQSQTVIAGQSATFTVTAINKAAMSYQWRFNTVPIAGATGTAYTGANVQTGDAGSYSVVITNIIGATTSADAVLTVNFSLTATAATGGTVSKSPDQASYAPNAAVTLTATASTNYVFFGWSGDASGTNNPLSVTMTTNQSIGGTFVSTATTNLIDNTDPGWTNDSPSGSWSVGSNAAVPKIGSNYLFTAGTGGSSITRSCRWTPTLAAAGYYNIFVFYQIGQNRTAGATYHVYYAGGSVSSLQNQYNPIGNQGGWFQVGTNLPFASGTGGYVELGNDAVDTAFVSADAAEFVYVGSATPPTITAQPQSQTLTAGSAATFSVTASGSATLSYQWRLNGTNISGATASSYTRASVQPGDAGSYAVIVTNFAGSATSSDALLTVNVLPVITLQPQPPTLSVTAGQSATFTVSATGTPSPAYQWRLNGTSIAGATATSYTRSNAQPGDAGSYSVVVTNLAGSVTSSNVILIVNVPPAITAQPQDQMVNQGASATFAVSATGTGPLSYQWQFNSTNIPGATGSSYTRSPAQTNDAGAYSVVITNVAGSVTSSNATLSVNAPPAIIAQPQSLSALVGSNVTFTVTATGTSPLGYQWRFNGTNIAAASASAYTRNNVQANDAGSYSVVVSNIAGTLVSSDAVLTVNQPSPPVIDSVSVAPDGQIQLQVSGPPGHYAVQDSTNLVDWTDLSNFVTTGATFQYLDTETNLMQRFYRMRWTP
jgi:uncharacterized lipoprotein YddW (UPF0748 family)